MKKPKHPLAEQMEMFLTRIGWINGWLFTGDTYTSRFTAEPRLVWLKPCTFLNVSASA